MQIIIIKNSLFVANKKMLHQKKKPWKDNSQILSDDYQSCFQFLKYSYMVLYFFQQKKNKFANVLFNFLFSAMNKRSLQPTSNIPSLVQNGWNIKDGSSSCAILYNGAGQLPQHLHKGTEQLQWFQNLHLSTKQNPLYWSLQVWKREL